MNYCDVTHYITFYDSKEFEKERVMAMLPEIIVDRINNQNISNRRKKKCD